MLRKVFLTTTNVSIKLGMANNKMAFPIVHRTMATLQAQKSKEIYDNILAEHEKPSSLSYFTGNFKYNDLLIDLDTLYKQYIDWKPITTPVIEEEGLNNTVKEGKEKVYAWKLRDKMSEMLAIPLKTSQWRKITLHLNQLASLPKPLPSPVQQVLAMYERVDNSNLQQQQQGGDMKIKKTLDELGRAYAVGRRKESSARCWVVEGEGKILVNGMELDDYFKQPMDREKVNLPLKVTELEEKYNVWTIVKGGGSTGQADAIKLGIGKALLIHDNELKPTLRKAGCITRDPRVVERKKEGQRKARARYTWVKR